MKWFRCGYFSSHFIEMIRSYVYTSSKIITIKKLLKSNVENILKNKFLFKQIFPLINLFRLF